MSIRVISRFGGYYCDACTKLFKPRPSERELSPYMGDQAVRERAALLGWRCYVGRSTRHYCPDCRPSKGSTLRLAWGEPRAAAPATGETTRRSPHD